MAEQVQMEIRPATCPHCGAPSRALGGPCGVVRLRCTDCQESLKASESTRASARREAERARADEASGFPLRFRGLDLWSMRGTGRDHELVLSHCRDFVKNFPARERKGHGLIFLGTTGTGKTSMACATAQAIRSKFGRRVCYSTAAKLVDRVRMPEDFRLIESADLLVLDEVGAEGSYEFPAKVMNALIDRRYADLQPTLIVSNLAHLPGQPSDPPTLWEHLGPASTDRLQATSRILGCAWPSLRARGASNGR